MTAAQDTGGSGTKPAIRLDRLEGLHAIARADPSCPVPPEIFAAPAGALVSVTRTREELSILAPEPLVAGLAGAGLTAVETGWAAFAVAGPLDFALTGVMARLSEPLAAAGVSLFAVSTYDTDIILVKADRAAEAIAAWRAAGHSLA
ncbi:ACT domain-containing protein [Paralimibaculum aggregatum]|uniref:ACT domain-containing protein n=1 Tax=Paralimibaculum aggregatum TaxID=3036245 RepID=A0ABQ6LT74_9RHOB|nr:ACT domain-containing protein [Limibaculum sp. NKW23]GMG85298.1 ACT domain-containing protein [Limibaculum sp. NKW23]